MPVLAGGLVMLLSELDASFVAMALVILLCSQDSFGSLDTQMFMLSSFQHLG